MCVAGPLQRLDNVLQKWVEQHQEQIDSFVEAGDREKLDAMDNELLSDLEQKHAGDAPLAIGRRSESESIAFRQSSSFSRGTDAVAAPWKPLCR